MYVIGVCAMDTKARSKPMRNILNRLIAAGDFEVVVFGDKVILDEDIENWPICDFLISFFSTDFPLQKAINYVNLRKPFCVNDLPMQDVFFDRRVVLEILDSVGVPTPKRLHTGSQTTIPKFSDYVIHRVQQETGLDLKTHFHRSSEPVIEQPDPDTIRVYGETLQKPFVEKPVSGEDHNIIIYYPQSMGGGARRLFRKVGNKSSEYVESLQTVRADGDFIYEEFMAVDNAEDVKVYTIGENYAHAETRKSPVVDGVVRRNAEGKEVRYITPLSDEEKEIATKVAKAFGQRICGFDLLRANGKSYVIDVNGWSFVKGNSDYYDKCASILRELFLTVTKTAGWTYNRQAVISRQASDSSRWKLKAFLSVLRHGDRTPKQKLKFSFKSKHFLDLLNGGEEEVALKKPEQLKIVGEACQMALKEGLDDQTSLEQLNMILSAKGELAGTKVQVKPSFSKKEPRTLEKVQLIVKWGGEFTHGGRHHSKDLGENLRKDLVIINKEVLDNVKIFSSSEGRVLATAQVFVQAFLNLVNIPDDMIKVSKEMLDDSVAAKEQTEAVKVELQSIINPGKPDHQLPATLALPEGAEDPVILTQEVIDILSLLREILRTNFANHDVEKIQARWCCNESPFLFRERWEKLFRDFCDVERTAFEPSKISELYDSIKYDLLHNREFIEVIFSSPKYGRDVLKQLYDKAKLLFDVIATLEYGITEKEKLEIGVLNAQAVIREILEDLKDATQPSTQPRTCLYFTKESKVISLLNVVLLSGLPTKVAHSEVCELDYMTQISFELYERTRGLASSEAPEVPREYSLRIGFSPGASDPNLIDLQLDSRHSLTVKPRRWISDHVSLDDALGFLEGTLKFAS
ncbi:histidine phosphatase superfamily-domain-containing protein [Polychytrium aggregatum]|uniref:histidine phosphatase superfamily-domain-containing protein n=1 Tax=Polychytrium aggregatum TaxID=110093 RepID=UPI0022FEF2AE|nr:histidine phosphatase superfamily-domain-containing protein [Polychytrium aggregatum]KAI9193097.1 histidine phosphatase superfamily-domain-containing protein [Polychytrium aggregatum]